MIAAATVFSACSNKIEQQNENGSVAVSVDEISDQYITKSGATLDVNAFDVVIEGEYFNYNGKYADMPDVFENVPAGTYTVSVTSPDQAAAAFDQPIVAGFREFVVKAGEITSVQVICTIQNVKVTVKPDSDFFTELYTYTISVSNGDSAENTLIWTNESLEGANYAELTKDNVETAKAGYFTATSELKVYVTGYRAITEEEAVYEGSISPIAARDHYIINLHAKTTGQVGGEGSKGIMLQVDYTTNDINEDITVPGFEHPGVDGPDDPSTGGGDDNGDQLEGLSLVWPANPDYGTYELKSTYSDDEVTLTVQAENYISGFVVKIASPTTEFLNTVLAIPGSEKVGEYAVLDLLNPETAAAMSFLPSGDALLNKSEIDFPLSSLLPLILAFDPAMGSIHTFVMEVTDTIGQVLTRELQFEYRGN